MYESSLEEINMGVVRIYRQYFKSEDQSREVKGTFREETEI